MSLTENTVKSILKLSRRVVPLVDADASIEVRSLRGREMLETGMLPLIRFRPDAETADADADKILTGARKIVVACSVKPLIVFEETEEPGELCVKDLSDADIMLLFSAIIKMSDSRFYGTNRTAFSDPEKFDSLIDAQMEVCSVLDMICRRYSLSPLEVLRWNDEEIATVLAIIEAAVFKAKEREGESNGD